MKFEIKDLPKLVRETKKSLRAALPGYAEAFQKVESEMRSRVDAIVKERESGQAVVPIVHCSDIEGGSVPAEMIAKIKQRGACVIRETFAPSQANAWNDEVTTYVEENGLDAKLANAAEDKYFGTLASAKPQIYGIYWSRPQVKARQAESLTRVRVFMNNLWKAESEGRRHFNPNEVPVYADRIRRRPPGSASLGLSPHVDGGSVERWLDENFRKVYRHVFSGNVQQYDAFDAAFRPEVREVPSPAVCSMFRTFQGWTALTRQGKGDGTLQLIPIAESMVYILLRALQDDVGEDDLCGAQPGRALSVNPQFHSLLIEALSSIPLMQPGDAGFGWPDQRDPRDGVGMIRHRLGPGQTLQPGPQALLRLAQRALRLLVRSSFRLDRSVSPRSPEHDDRGDDDRRQQQQQECREPRQIGREPCCHGLVVRFV